MGPTSRKLDSYEKLRELLAGIQSIDKELARLAAAAEDAEKRAEKQRDRRASLRLDARELAVQLNLEEELPPWDF